MPSLALTSLLAVFLGVASPPVQRAVFVNANTGPMPPAPFVQHPAPAALLSRPHASTARAVKRRRHTSTARHSAERRNIDEQHLDAQKQRAQKLAASGVFSGSDLVSSPNVFRGFSEGGAKFEPPEPLGREDELELVRRALFFIACTNAERALTEQARAATAASEMRDTSDDFHVFNHEEVIAEMRRAAEAQRVVRLYAARKRVGAGANIATEMPVDVPEDVSDAEFRLTIALGRAAYNKLFHHHQRLVYCEVNKVWGGWQRATVMEKADFLQEGAQGLLRAIRLFDPSRGVRFSTYASWHVRAFVLRALRDKSHIVRLPQSLQADMGQIRKARYRHAVETQGHTPSEAELADMLHWPASRVRAAIQGLVKAQATSLDADNGGYDSALSGESARDPMVARVASPKHGSAHAENAVYRKQLQKTLHEAMAERDPRRIQITRLKYGLEDGVEWTYPQLSQRFNQTTNVLKGIVRTEINFLRHKRRKVLQEFADHDI